MPHAAFCVVQLRNEAGQQVGCIVSMPHAAFCVVQYHRIADACPCECFNAARGILCGAIAQPVREEAAKASFNAARGILCGAISSDLSIAERARMFQCRTRHSVWCNPYYTQKKIDVDQFQCRTRHSVWCNFIGGSGSGVGAGVSMPHAAFCVVQWGQHDTECTDDRGFNAARGILCGAIWRHTHIRFVSSVSMPHAAFCVVQ